MYQQRELKQEIRKLFYQPDFEQITRRLKLYALPGTRKRVIPISEFNGFDPNMPEDERLDFLLWQSMGRDDYNSNDFGHGSLIEEMEMDTLNYLTKHKEDIDIRIGEHSADILKELVLFYEFNISYAEIGRKLSVSRRTIQRRIVEIQTDPLLLIECPLIAKILWVKGQDRRTANLGKYAVTKTIETDTICRDEEMEVSENVMQEI